MKIWKEKLKKFVALFTAAQMVFMFLAPAVSYAEVVPATPTPTTIVGWTFPSSQSDGVSNLGIVVNSGLKYLTSQGTDLVQYNAEGKLNVSTDKAARTDHWSVGDSWIISFDTTGYDTLSLSSAQASSKTGPKDFKIQYKIGASGIWTDIAGGVLSLPDNPNSVSNWGDANVSLPSLCGDQAVVYVQWIVTSNLSVDSSAVANISASGTNRIDDVYVYGYEITHALPDVTPPVFDPYSDIAVDAISINGALVNYALPTATDDSGATPTVLCSPLSDSQFPIGTTPVVCTATDGSGNSSTLTFNVIVKDTIAPATPTGLAWRSLDGVETYNCGDSVLLQPLVPIWKDNTETDFGYYEYSSFHPDGSIGLNEIVMYSSEFLNTWMPPADGTYGFAVRAVDTAGNKSSWALGAETLAGSCTINYQSEEQDIEDIPTAPTITAPINGQYFHTSPILNSWTPATDNDGILQYQVEYIYDDGHLFSGAPYRYTTDTLRYHSPSLSEQGGVTIGVRAIDTEGNYGEWSNSVHYYYDATAPTTPTMSGFKNPTLSCGVVTSTHSVTVDWENSTDLSGIAGYEYTIDYPKPDGTRGIWTIFLTSSQYSGTLNEGAHYIKVRALDNSGLYSEYSNICLITADWTAPDVEITTPEDDAVVSGTIEIRGSVTDDNPHHYWFVVTGPGGGVITIPGYTTGTINDTNSFTDQLLAVWDTTNFVDGVYIIKLEARDAAGNKDSGSVDWHTVTVDNTAPTADIDYYLGTGGSANGFKVVFSEDVNEAEAENPANYYLTNWPDYSASSGDLVGDASIVYDSTTHTATVTFSNPGWYVSPEQLWGVQNIHDLSGNLQSVNPYSEYSTPMVAPVTTASPDSGVYNQGIDVELTAVDPAIGSGVKTTYYSLDGAPYIAGDTIAVSAEGYHYLYFYSVDNAGNTEEQKFIDYAIDLTGPSISYVDPTPTDGLVTDENDFTVEVESEDAVRCEINLVDLGGTGMATNEDGSFWYDFILGEGTYQYYVECWDDAGNSTITPIRTITIDQTPPVLTLVGAATINQIQGAAFTDPGATAQDNEDGDITAQIVVTGSVNTAVLGTYTLYYDVTDSAGNVAQQISRTVSVVAAPVVRTIVTPVVAAPAVVAPVVTPTPTPTTPTEETTGEVEGVTEEDVQGAQTAAATEDLCPWWWIIALVYLAATAFLGGVIRAQDPEKWIRKYRLAWPAVMGVAAWLLHLWLHGDYSATWFCNNYWLIMLIIAILGEATYGYLLRNKSGNA